MTEINWSYTVYVDGHVARIGGFFTIDLSFPQRLFEQIASNYASCTIVVRNSIGEIYEKSWG